jgi:UrcA family protein
MNMTKTIPAIAALAAAAALLVPTVSRAEDENSVRVSYADLDLAKSIGQRKLQRRIVWAAQTVCGPTDERNLSYAHAVTACRNVAIADAQPAVKAAIAHALHPSVTVLDAAALVVTAH